MRISSLPSRSRPALAALAAVALAGLVGCGGGSDAEATERLWVSSVPTNPKAKTTAFLTTRTSDGKYLGAFFQGSLYRGGHDVFRWRAQTKNAATVEFLQDGQTARLRFEECKPSRGFDHCIILHGDPTGAGKYQSRKRWAVRRPGKKASVGFLVESMAELAEGDADLRAAFLEPTSKTSR